MATAHAAVLDPEFLYRAQTECLAAPHHAFELLDSAPGKPGSMRCQIEGEGDGQSASWFSTGALKSRGPLKEDLADGPWVYWYASGDKRAEGVCKKGLVTSDWKTYPRKNKRQPTAPKEKEEEQLKYCESQHEYATDSRGESSSYADAGASRAQEFKPRTSWLDFRFEPLNVLQSDGGSSYTLGLHYTPAWHIARSFSVVGDLGVFPLADAGAQDRFWVFQGALLLAAQVYGPIVLEGGWGKQYWAGRIDTGSILLFDAGWRAPIAKLRALRMIYAGINLFDNGSNPATEFRMGVEIAL